MKILKRFLPVMLIFILLSNAVTVDAKSKIRLNKYSATIYIGKSVTLKVKGIDEDTTVKWTTGNKSVATVSKKGKVKGKKKGKATITAKVGKKKYMCVVTVKKAKVNKVIEATPKDNVNSLKDYIDKNGFTTPAIKNKTIQWENKHGEGLGDVIMLLPDNMLDFISIANLELASKGFYGKFTFTINTEDLKTINIKESKMNFDARSYPFPDLEINMSDLVKENDIIFIDDVTINKEMNNMLDIVLDRFNTFMTEEVKLGLKDIGFTNYK